MQRKTITVEELNIELPAFDLEIEWSYHYKAAKIYGPPENCHPEEEEAEAEALDINKVVDRLLADPRLRNVIYGAIEDHVENAVGLYEIREWASDISD